MSEHKISVKGGTAAERLAVAKLYARGRIASDVVWATVAISVLYAYVTTADPWLLVAAVVTLGVRGRFGFGQ